MVSRAHDASGQRPPKRKSSPYVPWIRLAGRWLEHAGFAPGQRVKVNVEQGRLVITVE
ncbi:SymE family type I addiction module toxin [Caballeronia sp. INDeC2]|uniref:SymE family type I addiction module toxin n=1 Tax=Caballeronia sp. INDeC2 TaxID=2921747 RepID=UPI002028A42E